MVAGFSGVSEKLEIVARDAAKAVETAEKARQSVQRMETDLADNTRNEVSKAMLTSPVTPRHTPRGSEGAGRRANGQEGQHEKGNKLC
eukprot:4749458-Amphidinium_carterae.1